MKVQIVRLVAFIAFAALLTFIPASAHEGREVGDFTIEIGWRVEPAYTEMLNGPEILVTRHDAAEDPHDETEATSEEAHEETDEATEIGHEEPANGVPGLEETLQIEIIFGPASRVLFLKAVHHEPGRYTADVIPMMPGDYSFRVFGTIEGVEVDEMFSAADGQFSAVDPISDLQFP